MEKRIGEEIIKRLMKQQIEEFESICDQEEEQRWLGANCPEHQYIVRMKMAELEQEIINYRSRIPGVIPNKVQRAKTVQHNAKTASANLQTETQKNITAAKRVSENITAAKRVSDIIKNIGTDSSTEEFKRKLDVARKAFNNLTVQQKKYVDNYPRLLEAEKEYFRARRLAFERAVAVRRKSCSKKPLQ